MYMGKRVRHQLERDQDSYQLSTVEIKLVLLFRQASNTYIIIYVVARQKHKCNTYQEKIPTCQMGIFAFYIHDSNIIRTLHYRAFFYRGLAVKCCSTFVSYKEFFLK